MENKSNEISVEEKLRALYDLQIIDSRLDELRSVRGELPLEVEDLENEIGGLETRVDKFKAEVKQQKEEIKAQKLDIAQAEEMIKKYQEQQNNVRNNKEYEHLDKEIEYEKLNIELAEKKIKEFDAYKEAVAKNEELRKKKESEPTFDSKTENADIPFETIYKDDNTLDKGKEVTETEGINGVKEITTTYTVINGIRQDNPKVEEKVTKEKVDKVVRRGTKVSTTTTPELPNNTNKPISSSTGDSKPNTVTPADKPAVDNSTPTLANVTLENINNDISVTLATAETGVKLVTDEVTNPTTLNEVKEKITNENNSITSTTDITNLRVVDLTLEKEGKKYSTNANRTVRIALLNNEKGNEILVYHVKDNGELEELTKEKNNLTITNDNIEFTINHFSKFAIASIKKNIPTPSTNTSEEHNKNKDTRRDLTDIKSSESNQNKILPRTGVSSSSTVLLGATLLSLALISRKLKKN